MNGIAVHLIANQQYTRVLTLALAAICGLCSAQTLKLRSDGPDANRLGML